MRTAAEGPANLDALLDAGATLRISSQYRWRPVHGILAEVIADGADVLVKGSSVDLLGSGGINATAPASKLNG